MAYTKPISIAQKTLASQRFHAIHHIIFYRFHQEKSINIDPRNLMITRICQEANFLCGSHLASLYVSGHRAVPFLECGDLAYGMIYAAGVVSTSNIALDLLDNRCSTVCLMLTNVNFHV